MKLDLEAIFKKLLNSHAIHDHNCIICMLPLIHFAMHTCTHCMITVSDYLPLVCDYDNDYDYKNVINYNRLQL